MDLWWKPDVRLHVGGMKIAYRTISIHVYFHGSWTNSILYADMEWLYMKIILNQVLEDKGISQNKMAKDTGISTATLRNLNHNRTTRISFDILEKICIYLDCGVEDILCVEKDGWFFVNIWYDKSQSVLGLAFIFLMFFI